MLGGSKILLNCPPSREATSVIRPLHDNFGTFWAEHAEINYNYYLRFLLCLILDFLDSELKI